MTIVKEAVMALGQRYHSEKRKGDQETEILFYMESIVDLTEKLQIVAKFPDEQVTIISPLPQVALRALLTSF